MSDGDDVVIQASGRYTYAYLMNGLMPVDDAQLPGLPRTDYMTLRWGQPWARRP